MEWNSKNLLSERSTEPQRNVCARYWQLLAGLGVVGTISASALFLMPRTQVLAAATPTLLIVPTERYLIDGLTPSAHQMNRGDCYLFSGTGILEDSYRRYGVERGWFDPASYLRLSRQALGIAYMEACKKTPLSFCPGNEAHIHKDGMIVNMISWGNTTEGEDGGDEKIFAILSELSDLGSVGPIPDSVCPYQPQAGVASDWKCDGLQQARKKNPLSFRVKGYKTHFARDDIKRTLREGGKPLSLGLGEIKNIYYAPCDKRAGCEEATAQCVPCPMERVFQKVSCCVEVDRPMVSMKGEWSHLQGEPLVDAGGHAINIVGYNDHWRTEKGYEGGYILRNTWEDGVSTSHGMRARGSHSAAYFLQAHGDLEEAKVCPNPHSARSWQTCPDAAKCLSATTHMTAEATRKVLHLKCVDKGDVLPKGACEPGDNYFMTSLTEFGSAGLYTACFVRVPGTNINEATSKCLPPLLIDDLALVFGPTDAEVTRVGLNDPALCGYNFIPYATYETLGARFGGVTATSFDIEWSEQSYASRAKPGFDYSLVHESTLPLKSVPRYEPFQFAPNGL